jgi:branched-chain amino acid transport system substrate-binding protein
MTTASRVVLSGLAAIALAGCGASADDSAQGPLTVYVSVPLRGADAAQGRDIADGARLALDEAGGAAGDVEVDLEVLDDTGPAPRGAGWTPAAVARNARAASEDTSAIAYVGDFESGATRISLPITNQAVVPQVSPASTALDLAAPPEGGTDVPEEVQPTGERSFLRVIPDDRAQAEAGAAWAHELGVRRAVTLSDGSAFGDIVVQEFSEAAEGLGIEVREAARPDAVGRGRPQLVYLGAQGEDAAPTLRTAAAAAPGAVLMSSDALLYDSDAPALAGDVESRLRLTASAQDPSQLPPDAKRFETAFEREYGRPPGPYAAYGYEATLLVLDAIQRAGSDAEDRRAVLSELYDTEDRESVLGTYSIEETGDTSLDAIAGYRVEDGEPVFDRPLTAP